MAIVTASYKGSFPDLKSCPQTNQPEFAFIGRSNVGKSSLINMLCGQKELALTSSKPGKTRMINFFHVDEKWYLVDLPGLGYAVTSQSIRAGWEKMIRSYLSQRENLFCTFVLVDSRIPPQASDLQLIDWLGTSGIPFVIVSTKADKIGGKELGQHLEAFRHALSKSWDNLPLQFISSSRTEVGKSDLLGFIGESLKPLQKAR